MTVVTMLMRVIVLAMAILYEMACISEEVFSFKQVVYSVCSILLVLLFWLSWWV